MAAKILFIFGPSAVGKSSIAEELVEKYLILHLDIDQRNGFKKNDLPSEWDKDPGKVDFDHFLKSVHNRLFLKEAPAAVITFPTKHIFSLEQFRIAEGLGFNIVILWATEEQCIESRKKRAKLNRVRFNVGKYKDDNMRTFETYSQPEYSIYRINMFQYDDARWPLDYITTIILKRMSLFIELC